MKREIKFRAWEITGKKMHKVISIDLGTRPRVRTNEGFLCDGEFILMQYTGLKDKRGKEVWEGDIIKNNENEISPIKFSQAGFWPIDFDCEYGWPESEYIKVIGNIYENPELLKE